MTLLATDSLVVLAWLRTIPGLGAEAGSRLPATVGNSGFVQARIVGGPTDLDLPVGRPVVQVDCWATLPGSAGQLAQRIKAALRDQSRMGRRLALPDGYTPAQVLEAYPLGEPVDDDSDPGLYARLRFDCQFHWVALP